MAATTSGGEGLRFGGNRWRRQVGDPSRDFARWRVAAQPALHRLSYATVLQRCIDPRLMKYDNANIQ
uniref:Uncharacterized protein n=1 Tax=Leersia perrieri TaxID=77586 RepID=A0A0D9W458_9ORYZ